MISRRTLIRAGMAAPLLYSQTAKAITGQRLLLAGRAAINPAAAQLFNRMSPSPTAAEQTLIINLITPLQNAGVWQTMDAFYGLANFSQQAANLNWVSSNYTLTPVNSPTFTVNQGYTGNGTSSYLNTSFNPATATGANFTQNNCSMFVRSNTNIRGDNNCCLGNVSSNGFGPAANINPWNGSVNSGSYALNSGTNVNQYTPASAKGLFSVTRSGSSSFNVYEDASSLGSISSVSTTPVNSAFWICGASTISSTSTFFTTRQISIAGWGASLTSAQVSAMSAAITTYLTALGVS